MQSISNEQLHQELQALRTLVASIMIDEKSTLVWTAQDIADYFQFSYEHTKRAVIADPDFPNAIELQKRTGGKAANRWLAGDVIAFARKRARNRR